MKDEPAAEMVYSQPSSQWLAQASILLAVAGCGRTQVYDDDLAASLPDAAGVLVRDASVDARVRAADAGTRGPPDAFAPDAPPDVTDEAGSFDAPEPDAGMHRCSDGPVYIAYGVMGGSIPVDSDFVFFTGPGTPDPVLDRIEKDGGPWSRLALDAMWTFVLDDTFVYWGSQTEMHLVAKFGGAVQNIAATSAGPISIALDDASVYWITDGSQGPSRLMTAPKSGGAASEVVLDDQIGTLGDALVVDDSDIYWIDAAANLHATPKAGGASTILSDGQGAFSIVADATSIYYQAQSGGLYKVAKAGGTIQVLVPSSPNAPPYAIALLADYVYWLDSVAGAIEKIPKAGGAVTLVVQGTPGAVGSLSVDDNCVYWIDYEADTAGIPELMKADN